MLNNYFEILKEKKSNFEDSNIIKYNDMLNVPMGREMTYSDDKNPITGTRIQYENKEAISFRMFMPTGTVFIEHEHDCIETIVVYQGLLKDSLSQKEIGKMESITFNPFISHTIEALEDSIFYVEFKKL